MKLGFRMPSLNKRIAARISISHVIKHHQGLKAPKEIGMVRSDIRYFGY
jgi:hypothetical protein